MTVHREADGRFFAMVEQLPGVMAYGTDQADAVAATLRLAVAVMSEMAEHGEARPAERVELRLVEAA